MTKTGHIPIDLGKARTLYFDTNAMADIEDQTGEPLDELLRTPEKKMKKVSLLRVLLWACLLHEEPKLQVREAGALINLAPGDTAGEKQAYVMGKLMEAISATAAAPSKNGAGGTLQVPPSTGIEHGARLLSSG